MQTVSIRHAFRTLFHTPFVTLVAIASLALGIGANAAIFSLFEQFLLRPLPVEAPDDLVNLSAPGPKPGSTSCNNAGGCDEVLSYPMFRDLEREQTPFTGLAAHRTFGANLAYRNETMSGQGMFVSGSYFPVLGIQPAVGRLLGPNDDRTVGESPVVVLGHDYWRTRFDASPDIINDPLIVNGQALTIVGVAPAGFDGTTLGATPHVYAPITLRGLLQNSSGGFEARRSYWIYAFARLKPGVSMAQAQTAVNVPYSAIINDIEAPLQEGMSDQTLARFRAREVLLDEGAKGQSSIQDEAGAPLILLLGVAGLVLVIACSNIANLLLARAATREGEMAVRLSLGAGRGQLVGQLLLEACVLAALGAVSGLLVARWTLALIMSFLPAEALAMFPTGLSGMALAFTGVLALGTGLLFGLFPALHSTRPDLVAVLKRQTGQPSGSRSAAQFRTSLATVQIGLSMVLLVSAGLFTKSLYNVSQVDLGLDVENLVTFGVSPDRNGYTSEQSHALFARLEETLGALPGVTGVSAARVALLGGSNWGNAVRVEGFEAGPDTDIGSRYNEVGASYFATVGMTLMAGREFTPSDAADAPKVAVVNEEFARKFDLGRDAVGKWMGTGGREGELDIQIVGLARDAKYSDVKTEVPPLFFRPYRQNSDIGAVGFYLRSSTAPDQLLTAIPRVVADLDPNLPVENLRTMEAQVRENVFGDRILSVLSAAFAGLATLLAAIGLYGVLAYTVAQRTREIGLRMALGADRGQVRGLVLGQVGRMTLVGGGIGLLAAIGLGRLAHSLMFEMQNTDPLVLVGSVLTLTLVALGAGAIPAWRASRVEPMRALRFE
jgi:predicted permease